MSWKQILVAVLLLVSVAGALGGYFAMRKRPDVLQLPGVVEIQEVRLGSKLGGRIAEVFVREGDLVEAGKLLVRFESPELEAQLQQQTGRLAAVEAELEKAKNGPRAEEISQARSDLESAEADLKLADENFQRDEKLFAKGVLTRAEFDAERAIHHRSQTRVAFYRAHLDLLLAGTRPEEIALAAANLVEARGKLAEIKANLAEARVLAPEHSLVEVVAVRKGDLVTPNQPVVRVLRANDLWVKAYVPETDLGKVRLQQRVTVMIDAYPDRRFTGTIFQIASESEFTPRNIQSVEERRFQVFGVKIRVDDTQGIFKAGMAANVTFEFNTLRSEE